jgi:hypothetical protein
MRTANEGIASREAPVKAVPVVALVRAGCSGDADVPVDVVPLDAGLAEPELLAVRGSIPTTVRFGFWHSK